MLSGQLYVFIITSPKVVLVSVLERSENDVGCSPHCMGKCYLRRNLCMNLIRGHYS